MSFDAGPSFGAEEFRSLSLVVACASVSLSCLVVLVLLDSAFVEAILLPSTVMSTLSDDVLRLKPRNLG